MLKLDWKMPRSSFDSYTAQLQRAPKGDWNLVFVGKGAKEREVPLAKTVFGYLQDYFEVLGHGRNPVSWSKTLTLLTALGPEHQKAQKRKNQPLAARSLSEMLPATSMPPPRGSTT